MNKYIKFFIMSLLAVVMFSCGETGSISEEPEKPTAESIMTEKNPETTAEMTVAVTEENTQPPTESAGEYDGIIGDISGFFSGISENGGEYAVEVISAEGGSFHAGKEGKMTSASLIKLYVAGCVYENIADVKSLESYEGETDYLLSVMISESDNEACNTLVRRLGGGDAETGMNKVNDFCNAHGFYDTEINRLMLDFNGTENYTSAGDCNKFIMLCLDGEILGGAEIIGYMKNQKVMTKIPVGVPVDFGVANKTGELSDVENDCAVIYDLQSGEMIYIITVMTENLSDTYTAREAIIKTSERVFHSFAG